MKIAPQYVTPPATMFIRLLSMTLRYELIGYDTVSPLRDKGERLVSAVWHGELLPLCYLHRNQGVTAVVSQSYDGEIAAQVLHRFGYDTVRGSSSRGGMAALLGAHDQLTKKGSSVVFIADGPRGPRKRSKPGIFYMASKARALIVPVRVRVSHAKYFKKSWDRFCLPLPFARCRIFYGTPYALEAGEMDREALSRERIRLDEAMSRLAVEDQAATPLGKK